MDSVMEFKGMDFGENGMTSTSGSRGVRNRNPGNLRKSKDKWQGLASTQPDKEFFTFSAPKWGIRALAIVLIAYQDKHGINTIPGIIKRWAPPVENNTNAYTNAVLGATGKCRGEKINTHRYDDLEPLVKAIIQHENGMQPYSQMVIDEGLRLAGVVKPATVPTKDPEFNAPVAVAATNGVGQLDAVRDSLAPYVGSARDVTLIFLALSLIPMAVGIFYWWKKRQVKNG